MRHTFSHKYLIFHIEKSRCFMYIFRINIYTNYEMCFESLLISENYLYNIIHYKRIKSLPRTNWTEEFLINAIKNRYKTLYGWLQSVIVFTSTYKWIVHCVPSLLSLMMELIGRAIFVFSFRIKIHYTFVEISSYWYLIKVDVKKPRPVIILLSIDYS